VSGDTAPPFLTLALDENEWSASRCSYFTPEEKALIPTEKEDGWTSELVYTMQRKVTDPARNQTTDIQPIAD
jgi:hypothetical protein